MYHSKGLVTRQRSIAFSLNKQVPGKKNPPQFSILQFQDLITKLFALSVQIIP